MKATVLDVTEDLSWATMADIAEFAIAYGTIVLSAGLGHEQMVCWMPLQAVIGHYLAPRDLESTEEETFLKASANATREFSEFCKGAISLFGEKMCIPSWHQVSWFKTMTQTMRVCACYLHVATTCVCRLFAGHTNKRCSVDRCSC